MLSPRPRLALLVALPVVLAACDSERISRRQSAMEFDPVELEFGNVPVGLSAEKQAVLKNTGETSIDLSSIDLPQGFATHGFKDLSDEGTLEIGEEYDFAIIFQPEQQGEIQNFVVARGASLDNPVETPLGVHGVGIIRYIAEYEVSPPALDFGAVEVGITSQLSLGLKNVGNAAGDLTGAMTESGSTDFAIDETIPWPITFSEGLLGVFRVSFTPSAAGPVQDKLIITGAENPIVIEVRGEGRAPASEILCLPSAVFFPEVERGQTSSEQITCTARGGPAQVLSIDVTPSQEHFSIGSPPQLPQNLLTDEGVMVDVAFHPEGLPGAREATLNIHYMGGGTNRTVSVPLSGGVVAPAPESTSVTARLTWLDGATDLDLHFVKEGGTVFDTDTDCHFAEPSPDWGQTGDQSDDPFLDVDDVDGYGPEIINMNDVPRGNYDVYVHRFTGRFQDPTMAKVEMFLGGQGAGTFEKSLACNDLWHVGTVSWDGMAGLFRPVDTVEVTDKGNCAASVESYTPPDMEGIASGGCSVMSTADSSELLLLLGFVFLASRRSRRS